ncbi:GerAB/ArcD/ProY family transporter [Neobacillus muris]|uniref:GerAB/ArcD/ProY family transporter n=1 Tax=Neobacillus muris TaxID=2941334 RepID=UPI00203B26F6|nr:endospore germination permease [Neobacillus muris]
MKQIISNLQIMFLAVNFVISSAVISLPQITVHIGGQNSWLVPLINLPILTVIVYLLLGKPRYLESLKALFAIKKRSNLWEKGFIFFFMLFILFTFVRDVRAMIDFIGSVLLPSTPNSMIMVLTILAIVYISMAGLEVVARVNAIHSVILGIVIIILPLLLLNEIDVTNFQPLPSLSTGASVMKSVFFTFAWLGEMLFFLIAVGSINPMKEARRAVILGAVLSTFYFFIIIVLEIAVLGQKIIEEATFPSYILIQQINITDFLDRLDLVIAAVWMPTLITKTAFLLYALNHCLSFYYKSNTNKFLFPLSFILGYLSILLFKNSMEHIHFSLYTWSSLGLLLEGIIIVLFIVCRRRTRKNHEFRGKPIL